MTSTIDTLTATASDPGTPAAEPPTTTLIPAPPNPPPPAPVAPAEDESEPAVAVDPAELARQAEDAYRASLTAGNPLSGRELGDRHGRSERWGRERIAAVRASGQGAAKASGKGKTPTGHRRSKPTPAAAPAPAAAAAARARTADPAEPAPGGEPVRQQPPAPAASFAATVAAAETAAVAPAGGRFVSWVGFVFGSIISIAANVLHTWLPAADMPAGWAPSLESQIGAAVWPIGLLLSVEVLSRVRWRSGWQWKLARYGGAGTVALGSAIISYGHLRDLLLAWGYGWLAAHVGPLVIDGLMVISGFALLSMTGHGKPTRKEK